MQRIGDTELILNPDGSAYHINLKPEHVAQDIIFVGDPKRVGTIAGHFDSVEFETQKREFRTIVGNYRGKRFTVISTGIGPDNVDIVLNELDALVNINLETRTLRKELTSLRIVRLGTSGALQPDIPVDSIVMGKFGIGFDGLLHFYKAEHIFETEMEEAFIRHTSYPKNMARPYIVKNDSSLQKVLDSELIYSGITATTGGFFGPQGRVLRVPLADALLNDKIETFRFGDVRITNMEMETSAIYGLCKLLGHQAVSMNAIIGNRVDRTFSKDPYAAVDKLIRYSLEKLTA